MSGLIFKEDNKQIMDTLPFVGLEGNTRRTEG
jgi:hypothetical protein